MVGAGYEGVNRGGTRTYSARGEHSDRDQLARRAGKPRACEHAAVALLDHPGGQVGVETLDVAPELRVGPPVDARAQTLAAHLPVGRPALAPPPGATGPLLEQNTSPLERSGVTGMEHQHERRLLGRDAPGPGAASGCERPARGREPAARHRGRERDERADGGALARAPSARALCLPAWAARDAVVRGHFS